MDNIWIHTARAFAVIATLLGASSAMGADYYVAPSGDNGDPGSITRPFATIQHGVDQLQAGTWEVYRFLQRLVIQMLDESVLNGMENAVDRTVNSRRRTQSEVILRPGTAEKSARGAKSASRR